MRERDGKEIALIGIGMGGAGTWTREGLEALSQAQLWLGAERMLVCARRVWNEDAPLPRQEACYAPQALADRIAQASERRIAVLFSGDTGFFSGAEGLLRLLEETPQKVRVCPGVSSLSALCARMGLPWERVFCCSLHGRSANAAYAAATHRWTFVLTDGRVLPLARRLAAYGLEDALLHIGRRLFTEKEELLHMRAGDYAARQEEAALSCVLVENRAARPGGCLPEQEAFLRKEGIPISKEAARLFAASVFALPPDAVLYDIGCGSGGISVSLALRAPEGTVYAIDKNPEAAALTQENARRFAMDQITCLTGRAEEVMRELPAPAGVFLGGGGEPERMLSAVPGGRFAFAASAVTLETLEALRRLEARKEVTGLRVRQVAVTEVALRGGSHMLRADNPVWLASGWWDDGREQDGEEER